MANANPESTTQTTDLELKKVFDQFDSKGDGKVSVSKVNDVLKSMGRSYTFEEIDRLLDKIDKHRDENVNFEEFQKIMSSPELLKNQGSAANAGSG
ncbi:unnamed protein product [Arabis nemorensis]|uniref:EF-hand domain-containing protein n=1 Tax=Arabis nemorensis TaxID=586526 RepID=A0A565B250_9BRAS|nr:unnamed protein product [Arabis nemorensis]